MAVYADTLDAESLLLASAASRVYLAETGRVFLVGLRADAFYLRGLLDHLDVRPEVVRIGSHKTAGETLVREGMSPEQREQTEALLEDRWQVLVRGIAKGRGLEEARVRELEDKIDSMNILDGTRWLLKQVPRHPPFRSRLRQSLARTAGTQRRRPQGRAS